MNRSRGGNRRGGGNRGGGGGGGRHYAARGQSGQTTGQWAARGVVGAGAHLDNASSGSGSSEIGRRNSEKASVDVITKKFDDMHPNEPDSESHGSFNVPPNDGSFKGVQNDPETEISMVIQSRDQDVENCSSSPFIPISPQAVDYQFSPEVQSAKATSEGTTGIKKLDSSDSQHDVYSFDICEARSSNVVKLKTPLHIKNKAMRNEKHRVQGDNIKIFRPGMFLLKGYISLKDQVKLVKSCRDLGREPGGFYQPGYRDGAKLHLKMMCLGKNWDPETSTYGDKRPVDQTKPPPIPNEFQQLVKQAIQECHRHLEADPKVMNARDILPPMSPNICIINFYTKTGKLGLHQDKDESRESLGKELPVVSFSLGDTAEFLFGDERDVDKAVKLKLESGDVLIFGGKSRHIFHGVSNIEADTAPKPLLEETQLKPGRLNLTFREY